MAVTDRPQCCWTHCENEQGAGTWTEINGETLPVCEEHWFGNLARERRMLREALEDVTRQVINETEHHTFGKPAYDMTMDHLHDVAVTARKALG